MNKSSRLIGFSKQPNEIIIKNFKDSEVGLIPSDWEIGRVKDYFTLGRGRVISKPYIRENPGSFPVYSSQSFNNGEMGRIDTYDFDGTYLTWTTDGAYAGSVFFREGKFNCTNVCGTCLAKDLSVVNTKYAALYLETQAKKHVSYVGNPKLMNNIFAEIPIVLPPLPEQKKIAEILSGIDKLKKYCEKLKHKLLNYKSSLFEYIFDPDEVSKNNYFKKGKFSDLIILKRGFDLPVQDRIKGKIPIYGSNGITSYHNKSTQNYPGIVTGRSGSIGKVYISKEPFWALNTTLYSEKLFDNDIRYVYYFLQWFNLAKFSTGTGVPTLNRNNLHIQNINIPSISYQRNSAKVLSELDNRISKLELKIVKLDILRKGISSDLISGRKRVTI